MAVSIDRREFLKASGTTLAASVIGVSAASRSAQAGENTGRIKKALKYQMIQSKLSVTDKFKMLKDLGYDGVEISTRDKTDRKLFAKARDVAGLSIHGVINSSSSNPDIKSAVELSQYFGGSSVLVVAGRVNKQNSYDKVYRETQAIIRKAIPAAENTKSKF
jgi:L-ribulose-5-phosphate 3-epimerase